MITSQLHRHRPRHHILTSSFILSMMVSYTPESLMAFRNPTKNREAEAGMRPAEPVY